MKKDEQDRAPYGALPGHGVPWRPMAGALFAACALAPALAGDLAGPEFGAGSNLQASINLNSDMYSNMGGENNTVYLYQSGWNAQANVEQGGSSYSRAEISQHGADYHNLADIGQTGSGNQGMIYRHGGANQATIQQSGYDQHASITQQSGNHGYGYSNTASIRQGQ